MMPPFSLLVKPAGADCNLACGYCFYRDKLALHASRHPRMSLETLEKMLLGYRALPMAEHQVAFQGGEPLLMGEEFFRRASEIAPDVKFSLQTNATLVTPSLARFFAEHNWLVGVSPHGRTKEFFEGYHMLVDAGVLVNVLQLVTRHNVMRPEELYRFIRDELGCRNHQYIECTWPEEFAVNAEEWGEFLMRLFDEWRRLEDERRVSIRHIDSLVSEIVFGVPSLCSFANDCRHYFAVESNGDVYPCDFYVEKRWRLGNIAEDSWQDIASSRKYCEFGLRKRDHMDCPRNKHALDAAWEKFRAYAHEGLLECL